MKLNCTFSEKMKLRIKSFILSLSSLTPGVTVVILSLLDVNIKIGSRVSSMWLMIILLLHNLWKLEMNEGESNFQSNFSFSFKCIFYFKFLLPNGNRWYFSHNSFHYRHIQNFYIVVNTVLQINYSCLNNVSF